MSGGKDFSMYIKQAITRTLLFLVLPLCTPLYAAENDNDYARSSDAEREQVLHELQTTLAKATSRYQANSPALKAEAKAMYLFEKLYDKGSPRMQDALTHLVLGLAPAISERHATKNRKILAFERFLRHSFIGIRKEAANDEAREQTDLLKSALSSALRPSLKGFGTPVLKALLGVALAGGALYGGYKLKKWADELPGKIDRHINHTLSTSLETVKGSALPVDWRNFQHDNQQQLTVVNRGGTDYVAPLTKPNGDPNNFDQHGAIVVDTYLVRKPAATLGHLIQDANETNHQAREFLQRLQDQLAPLVNAANGAITVAQSDEVKELMRSISAALSDPNSNPGRMIGVLQALATPDAPLMRLLDDIAKEKAQTRAIHERNLRTKGILNEDGTFNEEDFTATPLANGSILFQRKIPSPATPERIDGGAGTEASLMRSPAATSASLAASDRDRASTSETSERLSMNNDSSDSYLWQATPGDVLMSGIGKTLLGASDFLERRQPGEGAELSGFSDVTKNVSREVNKKFRRLGAQIKMGLPGIASTETKILELQGQADQLRSDFYETLECIQRWAERGNSSGLQSLKQTYEARAPHVERLYTEIDNYFVNAATPMTETYDAAAGIVRDLKDMIWQGITPEQQKQLVLERSYAARTQNATRLSRSTDLGLQPRRRLGLFEVQRHMDKPHQDSKP